MYTVTVLFGKPVNELRFDQHFEKKHRPFLQQLPHLDCTRIHTALTAVEGESPYHCVLELCFSTEQALRDSLNSRAGQKMAQDYQHFATGGVTILVCKSEIEESS
jgi:uncharacterized protein (TIGR02118 family)